MLDDRGNPVRIIEISTDITQNKVGELLALAEQKVFKAVVETTSSIMHADRKGRISEINEKFISLSGYDRDEVVGQSLKFLYHPDMPKDTTDDIWSIVSKGNIYHGIIKNKTKTDGSYYADTVIEPVLGKDGTPEKYISVSYDITKHELERQNMRGILAAIDASYAYIEFDPDGIILTANENFLHLFGYQKHEVVGKHHRIFVEPELAHSAEYKQFWVDLNAGLAKNDAFKRITKTGQEVWIQAVYAPVRDETGKVVKIVKISTDITQQVLRTIDYQNRVKEYSNFINQISSGDLRQRASSKGTDELTNIGDNLNVMVENLANITREIEQASNTLLSSLSQIQFTVDTQATAATQQAVAVNEITTTLEEIRTTSEQNLSKTKQLGEVAARVQREGEHGQQVLEETIGGMGSIRERVDNIANTILALSEQTQQIGEITDVVTSIAQQSKMLALNASIEAAKAGEAGKGFAVVAAEVKELAIQSQQSTAQVQKILQDIRRATDRAVMATEEGNKRVDAGVLLVEKSREMMKQLSAVISETVMVSKQIVAAAHQEVAGIDQVAKSMNEINAVTSQFVDHTQETKEAAKNMKSVADRLEKSVRIYKT